MINTMQRAIAKRHADLKAQEGDKGFTLIELMVVIIIIGILAAIAIPVFLNQRQQAWAASVKSDLANASIAAESYSVANNGSYLKLDEDALKTNGFKATDGNTIKVGKVTATSYEFTMENKNMPGKIWTNTSGKVTDPK